MIYFKSISNSLIFAALFIVTLCSCGNDSATETTTTSPSTEEIKEAAKKEVTTVEANPTPPTETPKVEEKKIEEKVKEEKKPEKKKVKEKPKPRAKLVFNEPTHDYGFIMQGDSVRHNFEFKNVGDANLVITKVNASCGCTTPKYPKEAIPPGGTGKISVLFDSAGKLGRQNPSVEVYTNYKRKLTVRLKGFVDTERAKKPTVIKKEETKIDTLGGLK